MNRVATSDNIFKKYFVKKKKFPIRVFTLFLSFQDRRESLTKSTNTIQTPACLIYCADNGVQTSFRACPGQCPEFSGFAEVSQIRYGHNVLLPNQADVHRMTYSYVRGLARRGHCTVLGLLRVIPLKVLNSVCSLRI